MADGMRSPPPVPRRMEKAMRVLTVDAVEAARRRRQYEGLVLTQIHAQAVRHRERAMREGKTPLGRPIDGDDEALQEFKRPVSLIELVQASEAVFAIHGIGAPDDGVFQRYLLTLSTDPEPDWKKKLQRFLIKQQPRVKRLSKTGSVVDGGLARPPRPVASSAVRDPEMAVGSHRGTQDSGLLTPRSSSSSPSRDRFSDVLLSRTSIRSVQDKRTAKENQVRNPVAATPRRDKYLSPGRKLAMRKTDESPTKTIDITEELSTDILDGVDPARVSAIVVADTPSQIVSDGISVRDYRLLATSFQQWREMKTFKSIIHESRRQQLEVVQSIWPPMCTHALFRWITLTLPERNMLVTECQAMPAYVLRRMSILPTRNLSSLRRITHQLVTWVIRRIFVSWLIYARRLRVFRIRILIKRRTEVLELGSYCLRRWHNLVQHKHRESHMVELIEARRRLRELRSSFRNWQELYQDCKRKVDVEAYLRRKMLMKVFTLWCSKTSKLLLARVAWRRSVRRRLFLQWRKHTEYRRFQAIACTEADALWRSSKVSFYFNKWKVYAAIQQRVRARLASHHHNAYERRVRKVFQVWKAVYRNQCVVKDTANRLLNRHNRQLRRALLLGWLNYAQRKSELASILSTATKRRRLRVMAATLENWTKHFFTTMDEDGQKIESARRNARRILWVTWRRSTIILNICAYLTVKSSKHLVTEAMKKWQSYHQRKQHHALIISSLRGRLERAYKKAAFDAFASCIRAKYRVDEAMSDYVARKNVVQLRLHWDVWESRVKTRRIKRQREEFNKRAIRHISLRRCWTKWHQNYRVVDILTRAGISRRLGLQRECFSAWSGIVSGKRRTRQRILASQVALHRCRVRCSISKWKFHIGDRNRLAITSLRLKKLSDEYLYHRMWRIWRNTHRALSSRQDLLAVAVFRWQTRKLKAVFGTWKSIWTRQKHIRKLTVSIMTNSKSRMLLRCFCSWTQYIRSKSISRATIQAAEVHHQRWALTRSVIKWKLVRAHRHARLNAMNRCIQHWTGQKLSQVFQRWKIYLCHTRSNEQTALRARRHRENSLVARCFAEWMKWKLQRHKMRLKECETKVIIIQVRMRRCIQQLRVRVAEVKNLKSIRWLVAQNCTQGKKAVHFSRWKLFCAMRAEHREYEATQFAALQRFRLLRAVRKLEKFCQRRKLLQQTWMKALNHAKSLTAKKLFARWKSFTRERKLFRALEEKAMVFQVFATLPVYFQAWKRWVEGQQRHMMLVLRASNMLYNAQEAKAFRGWVDFVQVAKKTRRAVRLWQRHVEVRCLFRWKAFKAIQVHKIRNATRAANFASSTIQKRHFHEWRHFARRHRLLIHFTALWRAQTAKSCFEKWVKFAHTKKKARGVITRIRRSTVAHVFSVWRELIRREKSAIQQIHGRFRMLWTQDLLMTTFQRWKATSQRQRVIKLKVVQRLRRSKSSAFDSWRKEVIRQRTFRAYALKVQTQNKKLVLGCYWQFWMHQKALNEKLRGILMRFVRSCDRNRLQSAFLEWVLVTARLKKAHERHLRHRHEQLMRVFRIWISYTKKRQVTKDTQRQIVNLREEMLRKWLRDQVLERMELYSACERLSQSSRRLLIMVWRAWQSFHTSKKEAKKSVASLKKHLQQARCSDLSLILLSRWRSVHVSKSFECWRQAVYTNVWMRKQTARALLRWQTTHSRQFFNLWYTWTRTHAFKRAFSSMTRMNRLRRTWRRWSTYNSQNRREKSALQKSTARWRQRAIQQVFMRLKMHCSEAVARRRVITNAAGIRLARRQVISIERWHSYTVEQRTRRAQVAVASIMAYQKALLMHWTLWKDNVRSIKFHRQQLQANTERLQVLLMCSTFRAWSAVGERSRKLKRVVEQMSGRFDTARGRAILHRWLAYTVMKRTLRSKSESYWLTTRILKVLGALRENVVTRARERLNMNRVHSLLVMMKNHTVLSTFTSWKRFTTTKTLKRRTIGSYKRKVLASYWKSWLTVTQSRRMLREKLHHVIDMWQNKSFERTWNAWVLYVSIQIRKRENYEHAEQHHEVRRVSSTVLKWRAYSQANRFLKESGRKILILWKLRSTGRCFEQWQEYVLKQRAERMAVQIIVKNQESGMLSASWLTWRGQFAVIQAGKVAFLRRIWSAWRAQCSQRRRWGEFVQRQTSELSKLHQRLGIRRWQSFSVECKLERAMTLMSARFSSDQLKKSVFERWLRFACINREERNKMAVAVVRLKNRYQFMILKLLHTHATYQKTKRVKQAQARSFRQLYVTRSHFCAWKRAHEDTCDRKRKLAHYVNMMQNVSQRRSFDAWRDFTLHQVELRVKVGNALLRRHQWCTREVFATWVHFAKKNIKRRQATEFNSIQVARFVLRQWGRFLILSKIERMMGASAHRTLEKCFLEWRKRAKLNRSARTLMTTKKQRENQRVVQVCFMEWRQWSLTQARCKCILGSIAIGNHLRFRFLLWKQFTDQRLRLKRLMLGIPTSQTTGSANVGAEDQVNDDGELLEQAGQQSSAAISTATQLQRLSRSLHRFEIEWDDPKEVWLRWRHVFHARLFYRMRRLHGCFDSWKAWSARQTRLKTIISTLAVNRQSSSVSQVFRAWKQVVVRVKEIQIERRRERELWAIVNTEILRRDRKILERHWTAWRRIIGEKHNFRMSLVSYQRARLLTKYWLLWKHDVLPVLRAKRQRQNEWQGRMNYFHVTRSLRKMKTFAKTQRKMHSVVYRLLEAHREYLLTDCFQFWRVGSARHARIKAMEQSRRVRVLSHVMSLWDSWVAARLRQKSAVILFMRDHERELRVRTWKQWKSYVQYRQGQDELMAFAVDFHTKKCIQRRWWRRVQERRSLNDKKERVFDALTRTKLHRGLQVWHKVAHVWRLRRRCRLFVMRRMLALWRSNVRVALAERFDVFLLRQRVKKMLGSWRKVARTRSTWRELVAGAEDNREKRRMRSVWSRWLVIVAKGRKRKMASEFAQWAVQVKWFRRWRMAAAVSRNSRDERLETAILHAERQAKKFVLRQWKRGMGKQQQQRAVLFSVLVKIMSVCNVRLQQIVLREWLRAVRTQRRMFKFSSKVQLRRQRRWFWLWQTWVLMRKRHRQDTDDAAGYQQQRLLSTVFFAWQNYALAWKDAKNEAQMSTHRKNWNKVAPLSTSTEEEADQASFRRPLSPIMKRHRAKQQSKMLNADEAIASASEPKLSLSDAASLTLDVKKRLIVLGKWKPYHKSFDQT